MCINVLQAAKYLCKRSNWQLTNLELQKLVYLAHMIHLGKCNSIPMVQGTFEAWKRGPVHPILYDELKIYVSRPVRKSALENIEDLDYNTHRNQIKILNFLHKKFPPGSGSKLIKITHYRNGAWCKFYKPGEKNIPIHNDDIIREFESRQTES